MSTLESSPSPASPPADAPKGHPKALYYFFCGEFAERSSYYGMRVLLALYLTQVLRYSSTDATQISTVFKQACYFLPLVGGLIADRWLGRYWTIVGFCVPYVIGHFVLGIPTTTAMFIGLALLAGGSGVIKPNISALMGQTYDQQRPGQEVLRTAAFNWFYFAVNIGALVSMFSLPIVRDYYIRSNMTAEQLEAAADALARGEHIGNFAPAEVVQHAYAVAFAIPAWLMVISLAVFAAGKRTYAVESPERQELSPEERRLQWKTLGRLFGIFALVFLFWFGYEQNDNLWVFFTRDYVNLRVPLIDYTVSPDQLQFLNSLFVIILIPVFNVLFGRMDPEGKIFTRMRKILAGFIFTAAAIGIMSLAAFLTQGNTEQVMQGDKLVEVAKYKVSVFWPAIAYVVLTVGEVLLYGTMLELSYSAAPKNMKGFITACFLLTNTLGNMLNLACTPLYGGSLKDEVSQRGPISPGVYFGVTALIVLGAAVAFLYVGKQFEKSQAEAKEAGVT